MGIEGIKQLHTEDVSNTTLTPTTDIGTVRWEGQNEYVYVYNAGGSDIPPGYGCCLTGVTGHSVTISSVSNITPCLGVVQNATLVTASYGWVLKRGFMNLEASTISAFASGQNLQLGINGVFSDALTNAGAEGRGLAVVATLGSGWCRVMCNG